MASVWLTPNQVNGCVDAADVFASNATLHDEPESYTSLVQCDTPAPDTPQHQHPSTETESCQPGQVIPDPIPQPPNKNINENAVHVVVASTDVSHIDLPILGEYSFDDTFALLSNTIPVSTIIHDIGKTRNWSSKEIEADLCVLDAQRLRVVGDLRTLSADGWRDVPLVPIVKDLLQQCIWRSKSHGDRPRHVDVASHVAVTPIHQHVATENQPQAPHHLDQALLDSTVPTVSVSTESTSKPKWGSFTHPRMGQSATATKRSPIPHSASLDNMGTRSTPFDPKPVSNSIYTMRHVIDTTSLKKPIAPVDTGASGSSPSVTKITASAPVSTISSTKSINKLFPTRI